MAVEAAKAMRAADPKCTLIAPGAATFDWEYLEAVFKSGLLQYLDGVSVHPSYSDAPEAAVPDWARLRGLIGRYGPADKRQMPMIASAWGYSTGKDGDVSEETQGQYLTREWLSNLASGVDLTIYDDWKEDGADPKKDWNGWHVDDSHLGTVRHDLKPKPAFTAARTLIAALRGYTFRHRLAGKDEDDWKLLFQRGDTGDLALVTWNDDEYSAPAAERTPTVRKPAKTDKDYLPLLHLASVRFASGPFAVSQKDRTVLSVSSHNPGPNSASFTLDLVSNSRRGSAVSASKIRLPANSNKMSRVPLFLAPEHMAKGYVQPRLN